MNPSALAPYDHALSTETPLHLHHPDGRATTLDIARWLAAADDVDLAVVARAVSPVLDVGCGPGRIAAALTEHGHLALGVDISLQAVALTRARNLNALRRDVFESLPGHGRWRTIMLLDGNVGIGGDVDALLARCRSLLAPDGHLLVETHADDTTFEAGPVRFAVDDEPVGPEFPWGFVGMHALHASATRCELAVVEQWRAGGRHFAKLARTRS